MGVELMLGAIAVSTAVCVASVRLAFGALAARLEELARRVETHEASCESYRERTLQRLAMLEQAGR